MKILFFDVETNGLDPKSHSVLSICMIKTELQINNKKQLDLTDEKIFKRYYLPLEPLNENAIKVNRLTFDVINNKRKNNKWPCHFNDDHKTVLEFVKDVDRYVAHNLSFDKKFVPFEISRSDGFCIMKDFVIKNRKWVKLNIMTKLYDVDLSKLPPNENFHDAEYDTRCVMEIFKKAYEDEVLKKRIDKFLDSVSTEENFKPIGINYSRAIGILNDNLNEVKKYSVYMVRDLTNGCIYVGMTGRSIENRKEEHIKQALISPTSGLQEAINKKGPEKFEWILICKNLTHIIACEIEEALVSELKTQRPGWGYNKLRGGDDKVRLISTLDSKDVKIWRDLIVKTHRDRDFWKFRNEIVEKTISSLGGKHEKAYWQRKNSWNNRKGIGTVSPGGDDFYMKHTKRLWDMYQKEKNPAEKEKIMKKISVRHRQ